MPVPRNTILIGDARERLATLPDACVDTVITSPPYYQLRDYGVAGQIGLEATVENWVRELREVMRAVHRVLKPTGSVWLDLGDSYSRHPRYGAPPKGLLLAPERLLLALAGDGWIVRNKVIWAKTNPMPTSIVDRLNTTYDIVYLLVRSRRYFFDLHAIREPHRSGQSRSASAPAVPPEAIGPLSDSNLGLTRARADGLPGHPLGKNPGDVWQSATAGFKGAHFATFPPRLVERPLLATCPIKICAACGQPWRTRTTPRRIGRASKFVRDRFVNRYPVRYQVVHSDPVLAPGCDCGAPTQPGLVLDPFFGTGTVGAVARKLGRDWLGIELNPAYAELARQRLELVEGQGDQPTPTQMMRAV